MDPYLDMITLVLECTVISHMLKVKSYVLVFEHKDIQHFWNDLNIKNDNTIKSVYLELNKNKKKKNSY